MDNNDLKLNHQLSRGEINRNILISQLYYCRDSQTIGEINGVVN